MAETFLPLGARILPALAIGLLAVPAVAQQRPVQQVPQAREVPAWRDGDRRRGDEGRFVLRTFDGKLFLLDQESGCMWSRVSGSFGVEWFYEGPNGTRGQCNDALVKARQEASGAR